MRYLLRRLRVRTQWVILCPETGATLSGFESREDAEEECRWMRRVFWPPGGITYKVVWRFR